MTQNESVRVEPAALNLRVGDVVEVRSADEILATLDDRGELENLPFMPEMLTYCGRRMTVQAVAHKLCDTITYSGMRRMTNAVHLVDARCDGSDHGGCQTGCLLYWKEAWLKRVDASVPPAVGGSTDMADGRLLLPVLELNTRRGNGPDGEVRYSCQATELLRAAPEMVRIRDLSQYRRDLGSGNVGLFAIVRSFLIALHDRLQKIGVRVLPGWLTLIYGGNRWGFIGGRLTGRTPTADLGLRPGEFVRIRSRDEIIVTLDKNQMNRGMSFDPEMARYCGREARVLRRVDRVIDEKTGRMLTMKTPAVVLQNVVCAGVYKANCPRAIYSFWREIWLERVVPLAAGADPGHDRTAMGNGGGS